jgi:Spy/CpxP family protein refolding chaperone
MRFWLALTGLLLFAAGSAVGIAGARWIAPSPPAHDLSQFLPFNDAFGEREDLLEKVGLNDEQKRKLEELKDANKKDLAHLREEFRRISEALRKSIYEEVLTEDEQKIRFGELIAERERKRTEDRVRRDLARLGEDTGIPEDRRVLMFPVLYNAEMEKLGIFKTCSPKVAGEKLDAIREQRDGEIEKILGSDYSKYKDWKERRRKGGWGRGKDGRRDGPPGGPPPGPPPGAERKDPAKLQPAPQ